MVELFRYRGFIKLTARIGMGDDWKADTQAEVSGVPQGGGAFLAEIKSRQQLSEMIAATVA